MKPASVQRAVLGGAFATLLLVADAVLAQAPTPAAAPAAATTPATPPAADELSELVVLGVVPRYVAPTRRDSIGRIWAPVTINGQGPFRLVLDTGATHTAVVAAVAERLGSGVASSSQAVLRGVTGFKVVPMIKVDSLTIGDLWLTGSKLPIVTDALGGAEGVLGTEGLTDMRVHIDFRADLISINRSREQPAPAGFHVVPVQFGQRRLPLVRATMGGISVNAIIDTGGQGSIGNLALRDALRRRLSKEKASTDTITGATTDVQIGEGYPAPPIEFSDLRINNAHITFGDMQIFDYWNMTDEPTLLIGMDTLGQLDTLIIDYRMSELQLRLPSEVPR